jgi:hypothetical protein
MSPLFTALLVAPSLAVKVALDLDEEAVTAGNKA